MRAVLLFLLFTLTPSIALGAQGSLDSLAGTWNDTPSFITLGMCGSQPRLGDSSHETLCNPAQIADIDRPSVKAAGFAAGTETIFGIGDSLRQSQVDSTAVNRLLTDYNYSDLVISSELRYQRPGFILGVRPYRVQGQFQIHNPNLPIGSVSYRNELQLFAGMGYARTFGELRISAGVIATALTRKEVASEASLVDFAAKTPGELLSIQRTGGGFVDVGVGAQRPGWFSASVVARDLGGFWQGRDETSRYLFIRQDRTPRLLASISAIPKVWLGTLQLGVGMIAFLDPNRHVLDPAANTWEEQWFGTVSYFVGPLQAFSGIRPGLLRTGLQLDLGHVEASIAQEWINQLEAGRSTQPRFILGVGASI